MPDEKLVRIVKILAKKTQSGDVAWEETERDGVFQAGFPEYSLRVLLRTTGRSEDVVLRLYNQNGAVIEEIADVDFEDNEFKPDWETPYLAMKAIYEGVRRKAMGIDRALNDILQRLEGA